VEQPSSAFPRQKKGAGVIVAFEFFGELASQRGCAASELVS
jgi:hypothetical protein